MIYSLPTENVADSVTPVLATGVADADNPLANATDGDPAVPFFTTDALGIRLTWDFGSAERIDLVSIPMHNIPAGELVRFQMNATDAWGGPSLDGDMTIAAFLGDFPHTAFLDVTQVSGYLVGGYRFASLFVPNHGGITGIGDIELWTQKRELEFSLKYGVRHPMQRIWTRHDRRDGGRFEYDHQLLERGIVGKVTHDTTSFDKLEALQAATWAAQRNFLVNVAAAREALYVYWPGGFDPTLDNIDARDVGVEWIEVGRGQPL